MKDCGQLTMEVKNRIRTALQNAKKVSVTMDIWSSTKCKNSYLGVTVHLFNHKTKRRESYRIACRKFDQAHTGENIARMIHTIFVEYGIEEKVFYCLSDNGSNMKKGLRLVEEGSDVMDEDLDEDCWDAWDDRFEAEGAGGGDEENDIDSESDESEDEDWQEEDLVDGHRTALEDEMEEHRISFRRAGLKRLGCFPHTLQLPILKSTKKKRNAFGNMLRKTRKLVVKYRRSSKPKAVLAKTKFKKRLLGYCKTRWWTDYDMIKRLCEAKECDQVPGPLDILVDVMEWPQNLLINDRDYQYMKSYRDIMGLLKEKSDQMGAENVSTIHLVYPTLMEISAHLDEMSKKMFCKSLCT